MRETYGRGGSRRAQVKTMYDTTRALTLRGLMRKGESRLQLDAHARAVSPWASQHTHTHGLGMSA